MAIWASMNFWKMDMSTASSQQLKLSPLAHNNRGNRWTTSTFIVHARPTWPSYVLRTRPGQFLSRWHLRYIDRFRCYLRATTLRQLKALYPLYLVLNNLHYPRPYRPATMLPTRAILHSARILPRLTLFASPSVGLFVRNPPALYSQLLPARPYSSKKKNKEIELGEWEDDLFGEESSIRPGQKPLVLDEEVVLNETPFSWEDPPLVNTFKDKMCITN